MRMHTFEDASNVSRQTQSMWFCKNSNRWLLSPRRGLIVLDVYRLEKRVVKVVFLCCFEKHIHLFIRLIRTSLRAALSLAFSPCSLGTGTRGRAHEASGNDCIFVCFLLLLFPTFGVCVSCVCVFLQPLQTIQTLCPTKKLHIFILFTSFFPFKVQ